MKTASTCVKFSSANNFHHRSRQHVRRLGTAERKLHGLPSWRPHSISLISTRKPDLTIRHLQICSSTSRGHVDRDLWTALDMCDDGELETIYRELHGPSPFSPVVKSVVADGEPAGVLSVGRNSLMMKIESRFRFLAATSVETLRGERPTYRESLSHIRSKFGIQCPSTLDTEDLEAEIFLHLLKNYRSYVMEGNGIVADAAAAFIEGDGMSVPARSKRLSWRERVMAPLKFGKKEIMSTITALGGAVTFSALSDTIMHQMGVNMIRQQLTYQEALRVLCSQGTRNIVRKKAVQSAQRGLLVSTAQFGAMKSALSLIGPMMWAWLGVDMALKSIGTDYSRIVKTVFALAQVRLIRTRGFVQQKPSSLNV